jgi:hypothetical protein
MFDLTLTFDNSPEPETAPFVLDVLARRSIRTTFFVVGNKLSTGTSYSEGGLMGIKTCLAGLCLAVLAATVVEVPPVEAQTYTAQPDRPVNRPRARITVEPRSFLDAGTEVLPGERKFTDYRRVGRWRGGRPHHEGQRFAGR